MPGGDGHRWNWLIHYFSPLRSKWHTKCISFLHKALAKLTKPWKIQKDFAALGLKRYLINQFYAEREAKRIQISPLWLCKARARATTKWAKDDHYKLKFHSPSLEKHLSASANKSLKSCNPVWSNKEYKSWSLAYFAQTAGWLTTKTTSLDPSSTFRDPYITY